MADLEHHRNVHMYEIGIGGDNTVSSKGWKMRTFSTLLTKMGDEGVNLCPKSNYHTFVFNLASNSVVQYSNILKSNHTNIKGFLYRVARDKYKFSIFINFIR